jgi:hypothetical protein
MKSWKKVFFDTYKEMTKEIKTFDGTWKTDLSETLAASLGKYNLDKETIETFNGSEAEWKKIFYQCYLDFCRVKRIAVDADEKAESDACNSLMGCFEWALDTNGFEDEETFPALTEDVYIHLLARYDLE